MAVMEPLPLAAIGGAPLFLELGGVVVALGLLARVSVWWGMSPIPISAGAGRVSLSLVGVRLADLLDRDVLLGLAGRRSFERGSEYVEWSAVGRIDLSEEQAEVWVEGRDRYRVRLFVDGGRLGFDCTCPMGQRLAFCKHCVALALACDGVEVTWRPALDGLVPQLVELGSERLAELLVEHARDDDRLARRLHALMLRSDDEVDVAAHRALLDAAIVVLGFVPYGEAWGCFGEIGEAIDVLDDLLEGGHADAVVELAEHALRRLEDALGQVEDSGGGGTETIERLERLHLAACERSDIDRFALADRLLRWELDSDRGLFDGAIVRYAEVLGDAGRERYEALASERWAQVPALGPGDSIDLSVVIDGTSRARYKQRMRPVGSQGSRRDRRPRHLVPRFARVPLG